MGVICLSFWFTRRGSMTGATQCGKLIDWWCAKWITCLLTEFQTCGPVVLGRKSLQLCWTFINLEKCVGGSQYICKDFISNLNHCLVWFLDCRSPFMKRYLLTWKRSLNWKQGSDVDIAFDCSAQCVHCSVRYSSILNAPVSIPWRATKLGGWRRGQWRDIFRGKSRV